MDDRTRPWREILVAATAVAVLLCFLAPAATAVESKTATVDSKQIWTSTGVNLRKGQRVAVTATGRVHFGMQPIDALPPAGLPWPRCTTVAGSRVDAWPASGIACWSLIARVDGGPPIAVGAGRTITADRDGTLQLGVNDNELSDNRGSWIATLVVLPLPHRAGGSSSTPLLPALAAVVFVALAGVMVFARRRRPKRPEEHGSPVAPAFERPTTAVSPGDEDVNIYEVELTDDELLVAYSYFPDGVVIHWRITVNGATTANGDFAAVGGPDRHHVRFPIGRDAAPARAEIVFEWRVGDTPFSYAVSRQVV